MNYIKIPFKILESVLFFLLCKTIELFKKEESSHDKKWIWINNSFCEIDTVLIKYILKLNELGYETTFCCQGHTEYEKGKPVHYFPYISGKSLPKSLIKMAKDKNFRVKESDKAISIYFCEEGISFKDLNEKLFLNNIINTLEEWIVTENN